MAKVFWWHTYPEPIPNGIKTLTFHEDLPSGGMLLECGYCNHTFDDKDVESCPYCGEDLNYPRCDW